MRISGHAVDESHKAAEHGISPKAERRAESHNPVSVPPRI